MTNKFKNYFLSFFPMAIITCCYLFLCYMFSDLRFSDPDQYFHFALSREWATTGNIWKFSPVVGMGWENFFTDKEFLFHVVTSIGYFMGGDHGVIMAVRIVALSIPLLLYFISLEITKDRLLSFLFAITPFLSETFVVQLMQIRAFLLALALLLASLYFLIKEKPMAAGLCAFLFPWSYHAFYLPLFFYLLWLLSCNINHRPSRAGLYSILGIAIGLIIHPYFPSHLHMSWLSLQIVWDQLQFTGLNFGAEQEPFRTDNFLRVFRWPLLLLFFSISTTYIRLYRPKWFESMPNDKLKTTHFFLFLTSLSLFTLLLISPRIQTYFIPIVSLWSASTVVYYFRRKLVATALITIILIGNIMLHPHRGLSSQIQNFKQFDASYFLAIKDLPQNARIFNCDWWGGHYPIYAQPSMKVLDVLDPTLLRSYDDQLFNTVSFLRTGQMPDPYYMIKKILTYDYVLCSSNSPLDKQLSQDPRAILTTTENNSLEQLHVYQLEKPSGIEEITDFSYSLNDGKTWTDRPQNLNIPLSTFFTSRDLKTCALIRPNHDTLFSLNKDHYFFLMGTGLLSIFRDNQLYLSPTPLNLRNENSAIYIPLAPNSEWLFKICPTLSPTNLAIFTLTSDEYSKLCPTTKLPNSPYSIIENKCRTP